MNSTTSGGGQVQAAVWEHEQKKGKKSFTSYSCTFQRRYFDEEKEEWKSASGFRPTDLLTLAFAVQELYRQLTEEKQKE